MVKGESVEPTPEQRAELRAMTRNDLMQVIVGCYRAGVESILQSKPGRDMRVTASIQSGAFPPVDGMDRHQQAAIATARRADT